MGDQIHAALGICAYNEAANIRKALRSVFDQVLDGFVLDEIIVVSSGSTDGTDEIVKDLMAENSKLKLITQEGREGKNSAINCFLDKKTTEIAVMMNADTIFIDEGCLQNLLAPLRDSEVGVVGGHPFPTNDRKTVAGFASHVIWCMHHHVSMISPQIGEIIAFRDIGTRLSTKNSGDEGTLKMEIEKAGYKSVYAPEAKVWNHGPETANDFVKQRTRVNIGERIMKKDHDFDFPTWRIKNLYNAYLETIKDLGFHPVKMLAATILEFYSRVKALVHVRSNKGDIGTWEPVETTKRV